MSLGENCFYFLSDEYYEKFNTDGKLMTNKENGNMRPCFYGFKDKKTGVYWLIPISSKIEKYKPIYNKKVATSPKGECDTIQFGYVWGEEKAFLVQNMCPATESYLTNQYVRNEVLVLVDAKFEKQLIKRAKRILRHVRAGRTYLIFPNVIQIEKTLVEEISET